MQSSNRLQIQTEKLCHELLDVVQRFPKSQQFLFGRRLSELVVDALELGVRAQFASRTDQATLLQEMDLCFLRIRVLLRLATDRKLLSIGQLESLLRQMKTCGELLGSWTHSLSA